MNQLQALLNRHLERTPGLQAVIISDYQGVPVAKATSADFVETVADGIYAVTFSSCSGQADKLGLGENSMITTITDNRQIVQFKNPKLILTLISNTECKVGLLIQAGTELKGPLAQVAAHLP
ncbi:Ragulator complex protein LAMTOR3 [Polychytrium aggregatum]|uniref:Ragulator complex protein LAMTOR3 n=1 Tax=Polychytrium aggregatum TaxID=110093 RepID=UPI0022FEA8E2|nr:Ragulator complex protein LAMTOR3 [Polychytrium aggregatum]KAI9204719.1 Ragulator complex protein LAMTOR3 [Polychytrium aggregatum]